jgi:hypothetical protein
MNSVLKAIVLYYMCTRLVCFTMDNMTASRVLHISVQVGGFIGKLIKVY